MSPYQSLSFPVGVLAALVLALLPAAKAATAVGSSEAVGQVTLLVGEVLVVHRDGSQKALRLGSDVYVGDRILTSANGHVHLRFVDRGAASVRPGSSLEIQSYRYDPAKPEANEVRMRLDRGIARSISGDATDVDKSKFRMNTPLAAIGVRGTDFIVETGAYQMRAVVAEGAISVAPLDAVCVASGLGPCAGVGARELSATMGRMMVEMRNGEREARLTPALGGLLPAGYLAQSNPDGVARDRGASAEATDRAAAMSASFASLDPRLRSNDRTGADLLSLASVAGTADAGALTAAPDTQAQLVWGRWSFASTTFDDISLKYNDARVGREATVGDADGALFRRSVASGQTTLDANAGRFDLRLTRAQAVFDTGTTTEPAVVDGGVLSLDFGRRTFATALALSSANAGRAELRAGGTIQANGNFNAGDAEQRLSGAVTLDGKEAGYLFDRITSGGTFRGRTLWGRGP